jgi:hypothetical protein
LEQTIALESGPGLPERGASSLVDPVELPVEQGLGAALGEASLPGAGDVDDPEVALADEGDPPAVRGGLGAFLGFGRLDKGPDRSRPHVDGEDVARGRDDERGAVGKP